MKENWQIATLGEIVTFQSGVGFPLDLQGKTAGDYPLAKVGDISRVGRSSENVISAADHYVDSQDLIRLKTKPIPQGSVLFAKIGESIRNNHKVLAGCSLLIDNNAMAAIPSSRINSQFLFYCMRSIDLNRVATSTTVPSIRKSELEKLQIPLPPLPEQRRIAQILDKAEALRAKRRAALAKLDALAQSIFLEMFGHDLGSGSQSIQSLIDAGVILLHKDGNHGSLYPRPEDFRENGVPFLSAKSIDENGNISGGIEYLCVEKADKLRLGKIEKGDILLAHNASVGKVAVYDGRFERAIIGTSLTAFRPNRDRLLPMFLWSSFRSEIFQSQLMKNMGQTTRNQVPITAQRQLKISIPPLPLQQAFARRVEAIETLKAAHRASLAKLDALFASLQHRAFRGEL
ncbi:MAG: restriction endonuclease subunit S [Fibrobacterota bacterium]